MVYQGSCQEGAVGAWWWEGFLEEVAWAGHSGSPGSCLGSPERWGWGCGSGEAGKESWVLFSGAHHVLCLRQGAACPCTGPRDAPQSSSLGPYQYPLGGHTSSPTCLDCRPTRGLLIDLQPLPASTLALTPALTAAHSAYFLVCDLPRLHSHLSTHLPLVAYTPVRAFTLRLCLLTDLFLKSRAAFAVAENPSARLPILSGNACLYPSASPPPTPSFSGGLEPALRAPSPPAGPESKGRKPTQVCP